jgi:AcrR family transcriptional regulator
MLEFLTGHAFQLLTGQPEAPFSHEAVAAAAGVSARTVYRYFPTQSDLVAAVWRHLRDTTGTVWPHALGSIETDLRALYEQFERNDTLTRAVVAASPRANVSVHGSVEGRAAFRSALQPLLAPMTADAGDQLVATCVAIYSAPFWQMLRDRGQLPPEQAIAAACTAMRAVLAAATTDACGQRSTPAP